MGSGEDIDVAEVSEPRTSCSRKVAAPVPDDMPAVVLPSTEGTPSITKIDDVLRAEVNGDSFGVSGRGFDGGRAVLSFMLFAATD